VLYDRGSIEVGKQADLVVVEMAETPRVHATLRRGAPVYWDGYLANLVKYPSVILSDQLLAYS